LIEQALTEGPQFVTRRGKQAVVVLGAEEYARSCKPKPDLIEFLRSVPLGELDLERVPAISRADLDFGE
jgi:prevent-host-death family protein